MESGEPQMSDLSMDEIETAEASAEAPATETDYTAEMAQTFERLNPKDGLSRVPNEAQVAASQDYNVSEEPTETAEDPQQPSDGVRAPASLSPTMREQWGATPREMQQWIAEREAQTQQKISEQGRQLSELQRGPQAIMPHLEHVERIARETGLTPDATLQHWAAADHFLKTNPEGAIRYLAAAHGVDLAGFSSDDPQLQQAREMQAQQIEAMRAEHAQWHQQREQQEQHLTAAINRFAEGKPYWPQIESQVVQQLFAMKMADPGRVQADPLGALREAEKLALKLSGLEEQMPERKAEAKKKADEAKRLASLNVRSSSSSPNVKFSSMEEEMQAVYERLHGRH